MIKAPSKSAGVAGAKALEVAVEADVDAPKNIALRCGFTRTGVVENRLAAEQKVDESWDNRTGKKIGREHREDDGHREGAEEVFGGAFEKENRDKDDANAERGDECRHRDLLGSVQDGLEEGFFEAEVAIDIFDGDRGVVDEDANGEGKAA